MDARQAHIRSLRLIAEKGVGQMTHEQWSTLLGYTAARMQPFLRDIRHEQLGLVVRAEWDILTERISGQGLRKPAEIRAIFAKYEDDAMWGLTEDLHWLRVLRVTRGRIKVAEVTRLASPGEISDDPGVLDEFVYSHLWAVVRKRKARLEQKLEMATQTLNEFEAEVNLLQTFLDPKS
jgi:hypothetical protein